MLFSWSPMCLLARKVHTVDFLVALTSAVTMSLFITHNYICFPCASLVLLAFASNENMLSAGKTP